MSLFRRISATISGTVGQAVSQIENQDAIVDAILRQSRQELSKAKVRLNRVEADARRMELQQDSLQQASASWALRARRCAKADRDRAMECLKQKKGVDAQLESLNRSLEQHQQVRIRLRNEVEAAENRLSEVLNKQHLMRTRESAAKAMIGVGQLEHSAADDLSETFERWEIKVTEAEMYGGLDSTPVSDGFERAFVAEEEQAALSAELDELMAQSESVLDEQNRGGQ